MSWKLGWKLNVVNWSLQIINLLEFYLMFLFCGYFQSFRYIPSASAVNFRQELNCDFLHVGFPNQLGFLWIAIKFFFGNSCDGNSQRDWAISPKGLILRVALIAVNKNSSDLGVWKSSNLNVFFLMADFPQGLWACDFFVSIFPQGDTMTCNEMRSIWCINMSFRTTWKLSTE